MELWIRSQDKECLTIVNHLYTNDNCEIKQQNDLVLAIYKTKERALEVLDEIQNILQPRLIFHQPNIDYDDMIHSLTEDICLRTTQKVDMELKQAGQVVYQMPKE